MPSDSKTNSVVMVAHLATTVGVITAVCFSCLTLQESRLDREQRQKEHEEAVARLEDEQRHRSTPYLGFENPWYVVDVQFVHTPDDPLVDGEVTFVRDESGNLLHEDQVFHIVNYGKSPAVDARIQWEIEAINRKVFDKPEKGPELETSPAHILAGESAQFYYLPKVLATDLAKEIDFVAGRVILSCKNNEDGKVFSTTQQFTAHTSYGDGKAGIMFRFMQLNNKLPDWGANYWD